MDDVDDLACVAGCFLAAHHLELVLSVVRSSIVEDELVSLEDLLLAANDLVAAVVAFVWDDDFDFLDVVDYRQGCLQCHHCLFLVLVDPVGFDFEYGSCLVAVGFDE